jgi:alpha-beta hydrolase superfamily lysophospholipase
MVAGPAQSAPDETAEDAQAPSRRRKRLVVASVIAVVVVLSLVVIAGLVAWSFSGEVVDPDHSPFPEDVAVEAIKHGVVTLEQTEETSRPGVIGLVWQGGSAVAGRRLDETDDTVARRLLSLDGYLPAGKEVAISSYVYTGNPRRALGLRFRTVRVPDELGPMPAWLIPAAGRTWAIVVHGINSNPEAGLRISPTLHRLGIPALLISYREDLGSPASPDGHHHMGETEWRDLQAAARYALAHGARRLVLIGYSMGGALVTQFIERSPLAEKVSKLILDAPVLDWKRVLEFNASRIGFPAVAANTVEWAIDARIDPDWNSLDAIGHPGDFHLPVLLFHGEEDKVVPIEGSEEFAAELPRWVQFHPAPDAGHTEAWNVDPPLYERRVETFLKEEPAATYSPRGLPPKYHRR